MKLIYYVHKNKKYLDFQTILKMYPSSRSDLYRYLLDSDIETIYFNNKKLYLWDDILKDSLLFGCLDIEPIMNELS
jgi:hypothetical protein